MELIEDWRERLEEGIRRQPVEERMGLLERLLAAHESYEQIMESWAAEIERRLAAIAEETGFIPAEEVMAKMRTKVAAAEKNWQPPPVPEDIDNIEDQALHLTHDDFFALLVNVQAELPPDIDPHWRDDIRARIQAVPAEIERRYREAESGGNTEDQIRQTD
jgi:hypothetical protein